MGNTRNTGYLQNVITVSDTGNIAFMSGSTMLMSLNNTGQMSGSVPVLAAATASFVALAQSASNAVSAVTASFANVFTVAGNLTAQTLVVQTITSSVDFVTGSTRFGSILDNTHVFSGSVTMNPGGLFVSSSGTIVGIGTTSGIAGNSRMQLLIGGNSFGSLIAMGNNSNPNKFRIESDSGENVLFNNLSNTPMVFYTSGSERMRITGDGNIGIGITNPSTLLDLRLAAADNVTGSVSSSYAVASFIVSGSSGAQRGLQVGGPVGGITSPVFLKVFGTGNRFAVLNESNVENLTITSAGNVGVGTSSPYSRFTSVGSAVSWGENMTIYPASNGYITIALRLEGSDTTSGTWAIGKESSSSIGANTPQYMQIVKNALTGGALHRVDAVQTWHPNGNALFGFNVGIGTSSPSSSLHVYKDSDVWHARFGTSTGELRIGGATSSGAVIQSYTPGGSVRDLYIQRDGGKVGIGTTSPIATKLSLGTGIGAKFMVYDNGSNVFAGLGQDVAAGNSTDLFCHGLSNLGFLTFGRLGTNGSSYTEWARFDTSGNFNMNGGQIQSGGVGIVQIVPIGPTATNVSFTATINGQYTLGSASIPSSARWLLADIFITATVSDHQNFMFTRSNIGSQKSWVDTRGNNPASEFGNLTSTDIAICTYNGESDGYTPNYGVWYSSKLIPSVGRTCWINNYGNSNSNGYIYIIVRGYSL